MRAVLSLRFGVPFRKAFGDPEVFSAFVSDVLGVAIKVDHVEPEHSFARAPEFVKVEYDLFAEDSTHRIVVEVQHVRDDDALDRFLYYHCFSLLEQVRSSNDYHFQRDVYTLVVLTRKPRSPALHFSVASMDMDPLTEAGLPLGAFRHRLVFVNTRIVNDLTPPGARKWMNFINDSLDEEVDESLYPDPMMQRVLNAIKRESLDGEQLARLKDEAVWENAKREEREEGEARGKALGIVEGEAKGEAKGLRVALLAICDLLGLSVTELRHEAIAQADAEALTVWIAHLRQHRSWPER